MRSKFTIVRTYTLDKLSSLSLPANFAGRLLSAFLAVTTILVGASAAFAQVCSVEEARAKCCSMACCQSSIATFVQAPCCCTSDQPEDIATTSFWAPKRSSMFIANKVACPTFIEAFIREAGVSSKKYWNSNHRAHAPPTQLYLLHRALLI
jgi:hypothetical protein